MQEQLVDIVPVSFQRLGAIEDVDLFEFGAVLTQGRHQSIAVRLGMVLEPGSTESRLVAELYVVRGTQAEHLVKQIQQDVNVFMTARWG